MHEFKYLKLDLFKEIFYLLKYNIYFTKLNLTTRAVWWNEVFRIVHFCSNRPTRRWLNAARRAYMYLIRFVRGSYDKFRILINIKLNKYKA